MRKPKISRIKKKKLNDEITRQEVAIKISGIIPAVIEDRTNQDQGSHFHRDILKKPLRNV